MNKNPLIVFFKQSESHHVLPVAFNEQGKAFDPINGEGSEVAIMIILTEETDEIPRLEYINKDSKEPISVIWHNLNDEKRAGLGDYGEPFSVAEYSHTKDNSIYNAVKNILDEGVGVETFVSQWQNAADHSLFDELGAVMQLILLLEPDSDDSHLAYAQYDYLIKCFAQEVQESVNTIMDQGDVSGAIKQLEYLAGGLAPHRV